MHDAPTLQKWSFWVVAETYATDAITYLDIWMKSEHIHHVSKRNFFASASAGCLYSTCNQTRLFPPHIMNRLKSETANTPKISLRVLKRNFDFQKLQSVLV